MRLRYDEYKALDTEVVAVTVTQRERARLYHQVFNFVHPYACDHELEVTRRYGLNSDIGAMLRATVRSFMDPELRSLAFERVELPPGPREMAGATLQEGFFAIDRQGTVRYAQADDCTALAPTSPEVMHALASMS